jgi:hypothetical protein
MDAAVAHLGVCRLDSVGGVAQQNMRVRQSDDLVLGAPGIHDLPEGGTVGRLRGQIDALALIAPSYQGGQVLVRDGCGVGEVAL